MLKPNGLRPGKGARKRKHRRGVGTGSGSGCTAGRGNKGDKSRSGWRAKPYFEGGQTPLTRRIPKRGFTNAFRKQYQIINLCDLAAFEGYTGEIDVKVLYEHGLVSSDKLPVKVLGKGNISTPIVIKVDRYSKTAREKLQQAKATVR